MPQIGVLNSFTNGTVVDAGPHNANWTDVKSAFNTSAVLTDVAKTVAVTHTWTASQTFTGGATFGAAISGTTASFTGALAGLIDAASITSGNINSARIAGAYSNITGVGTLASLAVSGALTVGGLVSATATGTHTFGAVTGDTRFRVNSNTQYHFSAGNSSGQVVYFGAEAGGTAAAVISKHDGTAMAYFSPTGYVSIFDNWFELTERAAPGAAGANGARLFARDNGAGKTQLAVIFQSGAVQVIATEP